MAVKTQVNIRTPARILQYPTVSDYRKSSSGCFCVWSSAVENSSVSGRKMAQPYWKASDELFVFEVMFQTLNLSYLWIKNKRDYLQQIISLFLWTWEI